MSRSPFRSIWKRNGGPGLFRAMIRNPMSSLWGQTFGAGARRLGAMMPGPVRSAWGGADRMRRIGRKTMVGFLGFMTWLPVFIWTEQHVLEFTVVNGPSMYPFFNSDKDSTLKRDVLMNWKWNAREDLERGMIVTLMSPNNPQMTSIKRIVALEGDVIKTKKPYVIPTLRIPAEHVWVEGDGDQTVDSNTYGPVSKRMITGKLHYQIYPFDKFGEINWREHRRPLVKRAEDFPPPSDDN